MENMNKNAYISLASKGDNPMILEKNNQDNQSDDENTLGGRLLANMHDDFMISFDKTTRFKYFLKILKLIKYFKVYFVI